MCLIILMKLISTPLLRLFVLTIYRDMKNLHFLNI